MRVKIMMHTNGPDAGSREKIKAKQRGEILECREWNEFGDAGFAIYKDNIVVAVGTSCKEAWSNYRDPVVDIRTDHEKQVMCNLENPEVCESCQ